MLIEIKVPSVGESVTEALLAQWFKNDGDAVKKDEPLFVIETDKVTLEVVAEADGVLSIQVAEGGRVLHHLKGLAPDPANTILLPGFQAPGTRGAALASGALTARMDSSRSALG